MYIGYPSEDWPWTTKAHRICYQMDQSVKMALDDMSEGLLQVTNHRDHPTNKTYNYFSLERRADYFEILIAEKNIKFEKGSEETEKGKLIFI